LTTKLTLTVTLTLTDTVKAISQTKLGGELLPERHRTVATFTLSRKWRMAAYFTGCQSTRHTTNSSHGQVITLYKLTRHTVNSSHRHTVKSSQTL